MGSPASFTQYQKGPQTLLVGHLDVGDVPDNILLSQKSGSSASYTDVSTIMNRDVVSGSGGARISTADYAYISPGTLGNCEKTAEGLSCAYSTTVTGPIREISAGGNPTAALVPGVTRIDVTATGSIKLFRGVSAYTGATEKPGTCGEFHDLNADFQERICYLGDLNQTGGPEWAVITKNKSGDPLTQVSYIADTPIADMQRGRVFSHGSGGTLRVKGEVGDPVIADGTAILAVTKQHSYREDGKRGMSLSTTPSSSFFLMSGEHLGPVTIDPANQGIQVAGASLVE